MNIKQAKQEIQNTLRAYLAKVELGNYLIPSIRQRPVLLMGPPGIGKTQIMAQIAAEVGFQDANFFTRSFKRAEGVTPKDYRKSKKAP